METVSEIYCKRLEFDKICERVSAFAVSEDAKLRAAATQPVTELHEALEALDLTDALYSMCVHSSAPRIAAVSGIPEIAMRADKGGALSMGELLRVRTMLSNARALNSWYSDELDENGAANRVFFSLYEDSRLERDISESILSETEMSDDASAQLKDIRKKITRAESSVRERLDHIIRSTSTNKYLQDAIVTMRGGRFVVPVKHEHRSEIQGLVHDVSSSGSTYFVEPAAVVEANNTIMQLHGEERVEMDRILAAFSAQVAQVAQQLEQSYESFVQIDLALAKARYALETNASRPKLNCEGYVLLKKARHPLIDPKTVVPVDLSLGREYTSLIITGPNTGGKTVTLKTVGLLTLMAMSGMMVPALEGSELCVFKNVLVDIGDEQSIEQSLSTFSAHVKNIAQILKSADGDSLVLLDELGAGTDPAEGAALAMAILERLRTLGSRVLATTHYGEIKIYAIETEGVQNASCEFDVATLRPTYHLNIGIPGRSNALLIAQKLGMDDELLAQAKLGMTTQDRRFEDMMSEIDELKSEIARQKRDAEQISASAEEMRKKAKEEYDKLIAQGERELAASRLRAKQLASDVTANAYKLLDELKKLDAQKDKDRQAAKQRAKAIVNADSEKLFDLASEGVEIKPEELEPIDKVKVGDLVYVSALAQTGKVLCAPDAKGNVEVMAGLIRTRVNISALRKPPARKQPKPKAAPAKTPNLDTEEKRGGRNEINLLGMNSDEAIAETERFIDAAMLSHFSTVYLIHGKGTGTLRSAIQKHLRTLKCVKSFRTAGYGEGDSGVTIVELK